ncbi:hypothetical protein N8482_01265 [Chitinophagales bacterium]|nr:hypothetical protein [Chitinophagales bacterium]
MKIKKLSLYTTKLAAQREFYCSTMRFPLITEKRYSFTVKIGESLLQWKEVTEENKQPIYHFAFNIPRNNSREALAWIRERATILKDGDDELLYVEDWDATAIYFEDADGNIAELIARNTLEIEFELPFTSDSIFSISEIGTPCTDLSAFYEHLQAKVELPVYSGSTERFCALGNEEGLFIAVSPEKKYWFPTEELAKAADYEMQFSQSGLSYTAKYLSGKFSISI